MPFPSPNDTPAKKYLVTMALPYANGDIHLGHLVEAVQADVWVRFQKMCGNTAVFVCADDTHGTPIELSALKKGISPTELIESVWKNHVADYQGFDIGFDNYYSTNSPENRRYSELIYDGLRKAGLIIEKEIEQYYCEYDKRFLPDRFIVGTCPKCGAADQYGDVCEICGATYDPSELRDSKCILCKKPPLPKKSTHLFVDLAKCSVFLSQYLNSGVLQDDMRNFVNGFIEKGLREWCISRDGPYFGFEIPGYPGKFFYVWLDAPVGYIASTDKWCADKGKKIDDYWRNSECRVVHFIGKDIAYFHTLFWPVMLKYSGFSLPSRFFIHGFLNVNAEKMSKTRGTFILAREFLDRIKHAQAPQFLRFYFASKLPNYAGDIDLNVEEFANRVNTTLANNVGNLHNRTFVFIDRFFKSTIPDADWDQSIEQTAHQTAQEVAACYEAADYRTAVEKIHSLGSIGNKYYQDSKPWELIKKTPDEAAKVMVTCANLSRALAVMLKPLIPGIIKNIEQQFGKTLIWDDYKFSMRNCPVAKASILVQQIELADISWMAGTPGTPQQPTVLSEPEKELIDFDFFKKVDLRVAVIKQAEKIEKSNKLVKLQIDVGGKMRQIVAGIAEQYKAEDLMGKHIVIVANLKPATLMGQKSEGMLLAAKSGKSLILVTPEGMIDSGATVS